MGVATVTMPDGQTFKLGRIRPTARPNVLRFGAYFDESKVPTPKKTLDYYTKAMPAITQVLGNDSQGDCHDASTEVLTEHGWKLWPDYDGQSLLGTMNPISGFLEFQAPLAIKRREHNGKMAFAAHKGLDFALTPNHRMLYQKYDIPKPYVPGGAGYGLPQFGTIDNLPTRCMIPGSTTGFLGADLKNLAIGKRTWDGTDFLRLLALVISDGWVGGTENNWNRISFCCFNHDRRDTVAALAHRLGIEEVAGRDGVWLFSDAALANWLRSNIFTGNEYKSPFKKIPDIIKVSSQKQINEFLKFFGDQLHNPSHGRHFYSSSARLIDDIQDLLLRVGKRGTIVNRGIRGGGTKKDGTKIQGKHDAFELHEHQEGNIVLQRIKRCPTIEYDHYKGEVFCATVPNSTLVTRRNGRILISGNCTVASIMHMFGVATAWGHGTPAIGTSQEALSQYHKIGGPGDNGLQITSVLDWARTNGFVVGGQVYKIDGYCSVNWTDKIMTQVALDLFGSLKLGIALPRDWMQSPKIWGPTNSSIIGGHDVPAFGYDETGVIISTWGGLRTIVWDAFLSNQWVDEAYLPLPQAWYANANKSPSGVDIATLNADMNKINGGSIPDLDPIAPPWTWKDWS